MTNYLSSSFRGFLENLSLQSLSLQPYNLSRLYNLVQDFWDRWAPRSKINAPHFILPFHVLYYFRSIREIYPTSLKHLHTPHSISVVKCCLLANFNYEAIFLCYARKLSGSLLLRLYKWQHSKRIVVVMYILTAKQLFE